jgi:hypothetical protein
VGLALVVFVLQAFLRPLLSEALLALLLLVELSLKLQYLNILLVVVLVVLVELLQGQNLLQILLGGF